VLSTSTNSSYFTKAFNTVRPDFMWAVLHSYEGRIPKQVWDGGKTTGGLGSRGGAPVWGVGDEVPQKLKNF